MKIPISKEVRETLSNIPDDEAQFHINLIFNDILFKMQEKITAAKGNGVDVSQNEELISKLAGIWASVEGVFKVNKEMYTRLTILNGKYAAMLQRYEQDKKRYEDLKSAKFAEFNSEIKQEQKQG